MPLLRLLMTIDLTFIKEQNDASQAPESMDINSSRLLKTEAQSQSNKSFDKVDLCNSSLGIAFLHEQNMDRLDPMEHYL